jgi:hypothetical protein
MEMKKEEDPTLDLILPGLLAASLQFFCLQLKMEMKKGKEREALVVVLLHD